MTYQFALCACDRCFRIDGEDDDSELPVRVAFGPILTGPSPSLRVARRYRVNRAPSGTGFQVAIDDGEPAIFPDMGDLLFHLDKDLTIALQMQRPDLFFLHAAVVALDDRAVVLSAPSGTGKSTLALALLDDGFDYLSDELAPIDVRSVTVHAFPHALCLKSPPPAPYRMPPGAVRTEGRYYIPVNDLRGRARTQRLPIAAFVFLRPGSRTRSEYRQISPGTAAAHLISNSLNSLAHPAAGLDVAVMLSKAVPCFELDNGDLGAACNAVRQILQADSA